MTFREMLAQDLESVLINQAWTAVTREIEGRQVLVVEEFEGESAKRLWTGSSEIWMLESQDVTIHLSEAERLRTGLRPFYGGQRLLYQGEPTQVLRCNLTEGMWTVVLYGPSSHAEEG